MLAPTDSLQSATASGKTAQKSQGERPSAGNSGVAMDWPRASSRGSSGTATRTWHHFERYAATPSKLLDMKDRGYGWTVEMQVKAACAGLRIQEVPVLYRARIGRSKISGTLLGAASAGAKILCTIAKYALQRDPCRPGMVSRRGRRLEGSMGDAAEGTKLVGSAVQ